MSRIDLSFPAAAAASADRHPTHPPAGRTAPAAPPSRALGLLLLAEAALSFAPVIVLGAAIGWPASLRAPAAEQLAAVAAAPQAVAAGYGLYLLYSLLVVPVVIGLAHRVWGGLAHPAAATVAAFGAISALARAIGILRWLTVMPALAAAHAGADPATRAAIERQFEALTTYGGGIGELLGVSITMAIALAVLAVAAWRRRSLPRVLAAGGGVAAVLLGALALPAFGVAVHVPVAVAVTVLTVWMGAVGGWMVVRGR